MAMGNYYEAAMLFNWHYPNGLKWIKESKRQIFNINNHKMTTIREMVNIISKISQKKIIKHKGFIKGSPKIIKISNKKILNAINYQISTSLKDGLAKTFNWYTNLIN